MNPTELKTWFAQTKQILENAYLAHNESWKQSGFSGPEERWVQCRKPIADCIDRSGTFLDIGCANGYLTECILKWTSEKGIAIIPYGLDLSEKLVELAKERVPKFAVNFLAGNAWFWISPLKFDFVRTELVYVPEELQKDFVKRLLRDFINDNGKLLIVEYRSSKDDHSKRWVNEDLEDWGFKVSDCKSGFWEGKEMTRVITRIKNV